MTAAETVWFLIIIAVGLLVGTALARVAIAKQRDAAFWFLAGFSLPFIAPIWLLFTPHRQKVRRPERIRRYEWTWVRWINRYLVSVQVVTVVRVVEFVLDSSAPLGVQETDVGTMYLPAVGLFWTAWAFVAASGLARLALSIDRPFFAVARVVLDEALHSRVALGFIALLMLALTLLAAIFTGDAEQPLRYRVQSFLSWSYISLGVMLGALTILFACWTLSSEIKLQRIFTVAVKPINRPAYVLGKWLGIVALDAVLLVVASTAIYSFTVFYMANLPPTDHYDRDALTDEVLTARIAIEPIPETPMPVQALALVDRMTEMELTDIGRQIADRESLIGLGDETLLALGRDEAVRQKTQEVASKWLTVNQGESKTYHFRGLERFSADFRRRVDRWKEEAAAADAAGRRRPDPPIRFFQLRYQLISSAYLDDGRVNLVLKINDQNIQPDQTMIDFPMVVGAPQAISVPAYFISEQGTIDFKVESPIALRNPPVRFDMEGGLEVMYTAGSFTGNFVRSMLALWVKLSFLAMLGIAAATCLGFPVACLLSMLISLGAVSSPFLIESAESFSIQGDSAAYTFIDMVVSTITYYLAAALRQFAEYRPGNLLASGRLFSWGQLGGCVLWIGGAWIAVAGVLAAFTFHRRELARVQV